MRGEKWKRDLGRLHAYRQAKVNRFPILKGLSLDAIQTCAVFGVGIGFGIKLLDLDFAFGHFAEIFEKVFDVLRAPHTEEPTNWSRRYKANLEKLASGNPLKVAEVVRDLWRRERERGLSAGEKRMLAKARDILVGEVALAEKSTKDEAESLLDKVLTEA